MQLTDVPVQSLVGHLLVLVRVSCWLVVAPPFSHKAIPAQVKALLSLGIALAVGAATDFSHVSLDTGDLAIAVVWQVVTGLALGFCCYLVFAAVEAAGSLIDLFGGFQLASGYDPQMQSGNAAFGRLYQFTTIVLLFVSDGYLVIFHGLTSSFDAIGVTEGASVQVLARVLTDGVGQLGLSALQIAGPLMAILFLTDVGLGLLTRAAPAVQAFSLGPPLKILITLSAATFAVAMLPSVVDGMADQANHTTVQVSSASTAAPAGAAADGSAGGDR